MDEPSPGKSEEAEKKLGQSETETEMSSQLKAGTILKIMLGKLCCRQLVGESKSVVDLPGVEEKV